jgi:hypothetical protein
MATFSPTNSEDEHVLWEDSNQFAVMQEIAIESSTPSVDDFLKGKPGEPDRGTPAPSESRTSGDTL